MVAKEDQNREIVYKEGRNLPVDQARCAKCWRDVLMNNKTSMCHTYCAFDDCDLTHGGK